MSQIERRLHEWFNADPFAKAIAVIQGVGLPSATAAVATMGNVRQLKSGPEFVGG